MWIKKVIFCVMIGIAILAANVHELQAQTYAKGSVPAVSIINSDNSNAIQKARTEVLRQEGIEIEWEELMQSSEQLDVQVQEGQKKQDVINWIQQPKLNINGIRVVNPYVAYGYEQMMEDAQQLEKLYPDIIKLDNIGQSVEGRQLMLIKLGRGNKKVLLCGSHHAREYISSAYLMKMIDEYAFYYKSEKSFGDFQVKNLLDQITVYIVPMVNPDGVNLVQNGIRAVKDFEKVKSIKMLQPTYSQWKANINGVDLNRQYPAAWDVKKSNTHVPSSEMFKGDSAASEPEIQAMMKLSRQYEFLMAASFHSKGEVIYWADSGTFKDIPSAEYIANKLLNLTGYKKMPISQDPAIYGAGYENWFRLQFKRPAFCIELTPYNETDIPHPDERFDSLVWDKGKHIGLLLIQEALNLK